MRGKSKKGAGQAVVDKLSGLPTPKPDPKSQDQGKARASQTPGKAGMKRDEVAAALLTLRTPTDSKSATTSADGVIVESMVVSKNTRELKTGRPQRQAAAKGAQV